MSSSSQTEHVPILTQEMLHYFDGVRLNTFYDGTLGAGGHARALLEAHPEIRRYLGCDRDPEALAIARKNLQPWEGKVEWIHGNFADLDCHLKDRQLASVDGFFLI